VALPTTPIDYSPDHDQPPLQQQTSGQSFAPDQCQSTNFCSLMSVIISSWLHEVCELSQITILELYHLRASTSVLCFETRQAQNYSRLLMKEQQTT